VAKQLALHVGHGKTGSSYLQAWLALNAQRLTAVGVTYPLEAPSGRCERRAQRGLFSMGNGFVLEEIEAAADPTAALAALAAHVPDGGTLLISDERLMKRLVGRLPSLTALAAAAGFEGLQLLLLVRDPLEHARSLYLEMVKAHGYAGSFGDWLAITNLHDYVLLFLQEQAALHGGVPCQLTVHNYSRIRAAILPALRQWLDLPAASTDWPLPPRQRVNRSFSRTELGLQRRLNRLLGRRAGGFGRLLVRLRPRAEAARPGASPAEVERFRARLAPVVWGINQHVAAGQELQG
jgi:hypothetical protein